MRKRFVSLLTIVTSVILLGGCGDDSEYKEISSLESIDTSSVSSVSSITALSKSDRENLIYQQIADRTLIDTTALDTISNEDGAVISNYIEDICARLKGADNDSLSDSFTNYLLFEMEKTPYEWSKSTVEILGINSSSRSFIVDVTFKTNNKLKNVKSDSAIPIGDPDYDRKCKNRLERYLEILEYKKNDYNGVYDWQSKLDEFEEHYGTVESIIDSQIDYSLYEKAMQGEVNTYSCMVDSEVEQLGATMKVRFILSYEYSLGVKLGMSCDHMYIVNYTLETDPLEDLDTLTIEGSSTISDAVDSLIYSENRAIDEDNYNGLYSLIDDFGKYDKYYYDMFETSYRKIKGYVIALYDVDGTTITAGVTRVRKIRAKGSNMSYPTYEEKWLYTIELVGNELEIINEVLIYSTLIGEPAIVSNTDANDVDGFVSSVSITDDDKVEIENSISDFCTLQVNNDENSDRFLNTIDISISARELSQLKEDMFSIEGVVSKATWIKNYNTAYTNYVNLTLLEVFYKEDGTALECESTVSLIYKNSSRWQVFEYTRLSAVSINPDSVSTTSSLCHVYKDDNYSGSIDDESDSGDFSNVEIDSVGDSTQAEGTNEQNSTENDSDKVTDFSDIKECTEVEENEKYSELESLEEMLGVE